MFDGTQFSIQKYHMKIIFKAKKVLQNGFEKRPILDTLHITLEDQVLLDTTDEKNANARMFISKCIPQKVLEKLTNCPSAEMWLKLCSLHLKKLLRVFLLFRNFFLDIRFKLLILQIQSLFIPKNGTYSILIELISNVFSIS